jgi:hypothetical protein
MFFALALVLFGVAWMLRSLGVYNDQVFGLVGSFLLIFAGVLKLLQLNSKHSSKDEHGF